MKIIMFHGTSCPHCHHMMPIVDTLIKEGIEIEKKEVWNNDKNADEMRSLKEIIEPTCGDGLGVPAFVDIERKRSTCGEQTYEELKSWLTK